MQAETITRHSLPPQMLYCMYLLLLYFALNLSVLQSLFLDCHLF